MGGQLLLRGVGGQLGLSSEQEYLVQVRAVDLADRTSTSTIQAQLRIDTTAPERTSEAACVHFQATVGLQGLFTEDCNSADRAEYTEGGCIIYKVSLSTSDENGSKNLLGSGNLLRWYATRKPFVLIPAGALPSWWRRLEAAKSVYVSVTVVALNFAGMQTTYSKVVKVGT